MKHVFPIALFFLLSAAGCGHYPRPIGSLQDIKRTAPTEYMIVAQGLPAADWGALGRFAGLEHLGVARDFAPMVTDDHLTALSRCPLPRLRQVSFAYCDNIGDAGFMALGQLKSIEGLQLDRTAITDSGLHGLVSALPHLKGLNLSGCRYVTKQGLLGIAAFSSVSSLGLSLGPLTQADIESLISAMPHVSHWTIRDEGGALAIESLRAVASRYHATVIIIDAHNSARSL